jgi:LmbE family N-acetylglucosaminyl deacetylase|tara:strand:- start:3386 stop:4012 length:627 start_codon:yes stop_codon:yes gene_type:complete
MKKLVISPHIDDEILGCGGILDKDTFVVYCGFDETHIKGEWVRERPDTNTRLKELNKVQSLLKFKYEILFNKVNHYVEQDLISSFEKAINEIKPEQIYIPNPSYNQDHKTVYDAAMVALRPHDLNHFVSKVLIYEQPQVYLWNNTSREFKPNYFVPIDINKKIKAYKLMATQVRTFRSPEMLRALALLRGGQCNFKYAEGFEIIRWID